jgi:hypothetical protein
MGSLLIAAVEIISKNNNEKGIIIIMSTRVSENSISQ